MCLSNEDLKLSLYIGQLEKNTKRFFNISFSVLSFTASTTVTTVSSTTVTSKCDVPFVHSQDLSSSYRRKSTVPTCDSKSAVSCVLHSEVHDESRQGLLEMFFYKRPVEKTFAS